MEEPGVLKGNWDFNGKVKTTGQCLTPEVHTLSAYRLVMSTNNFHTS